MPVKWCIDSANLSVKYSHSVNGASKQRDISLQMSFWFLYRFLENNILTKEAKRKIILKSEMYSRHWLANSQIIWNLVSRVLDIIRIFFRGLLYPKNLSFLCCKTLTLRWIWLIINESCYNTRLTIWMEHSLISQIIDGKFIKNVLRPL